MSRLMFNKEFVPTDEILKEKTRACQLVREGKPIVAGSNSRGSDHD